MSDERKKKILDKYEQSLQNGERFWPDSIYKDLLVSFAIFLLLVGLAAFIGVPGEPKADPADASYVPKPEWYFLFLFKFLALYGQIPLLGKIEWIATALIPGLVVMAILILPLIDKNPYRYYSRRVLAITGMFVSVVAIVVLTLISDIPTAAGEDGGMTLGTLFQFLAGVVLPGLAMAILVGLTYLAQKYSYNVIKPQIWVAGISSAAMLVLSVLVLVMAPPVEAKEEVSIAGSLAEQILIGQDLFSVHCVECHGGEGEGGEIKGVEGLEGVVLDPINARDVMYTFTDETLYNIIAYGQPDLGMPPFGKAFGGELAPSDMDNMVAFMRYTWDDRAELPQEVAQANAIPALGPDEAPSYDVHIAPLFKRYCISCHRPGKKNQNYLMRDYAEVMTSGDNQPNVIASDLNSNLILMINRQEIEAGGPMPPTRALKPEIIDIITRWVLAGAPQTAEEAAAAGAAVPAQPLSTATPEGTAIPTP